MGKKFDVTIKVRLCQIHREYFDNVVSAKKNNRNKIDYFTLARFMELVCRCPYCDIETKEE